jgi:glycosyltransferase involved in cell wall biosynthesis
MTDKNTLKEIHNLQKRLTSDFKVSLNDFKKDIIYQSLLIERVVPNPDPIAMMTGWSIAPEFAWWIHNFLLKTKPKKIIELGSGVSTLVIASTLKSKNIKSRYMSFEHDSEYYVKTKKDIQDSGLEEYVDLIYSPLEDIDIEGKKYKFYSFPYNILDKEIGENELDVLLVDGPPASTNHWARFPALKCLKKYLSKNTITILDESSRVEEKEILKEWLVDFDENEVVFLHEIRHTPALFANKSKLKFCDFSLGEAIQKNENENLRLDFYREEVDKLISMNSKLEIKIKDQHVEIKSFEKQINELNKDLNKEISRVRDLENQISSLKGSLIYHLGIASYNLTRRRVDWIKLPFALRRVMSRYKEKRIGFKKYTKNASKELITLIETSNKSNILQVADSISKELGLKESIRFINENGSSEHKKVIDIFSANLNVDNEKTWLNHVNSFISNENLAKVDLSDGNEARFLRIKGDRSRSVKDMPLVSVLMTAYNAEKTIGHSIDSILNQTWSNLELIIVDDYSTDSTYRIITEFEKEDPRVKVFKNKVNVGPYVSKNVALSHSKGDYVTGQDADDWSLPERIENDMQVLLKNNRYKATLSCMLRMDYNGKFSRISSIGANSPDGVRRIAMISLLIEANVLKSIFGGWDSVRFGGDSELVSRVEKIIGDGFFKNNNIGMFCLDHEDSLTNDAVHGICKVKGISDSRKSYSKSYKEWHSKINKESARIDFPQTIRKFPAPDAMVVLASDVDHVIE